MKSSPTVIIKIIIIIKLYFDTIKSGTYVPFTGVYIHVMYAETCADCF